MFSFLNNKLANFFQVQQVPLVRRAEMRQHQRFEIVFLRKLSTLGFSTIYFDCLSTSDKLAVR